VQRRQSDRADVGKRTDPCQHAVGELAAEVERAALQRRGQQRHLQRKGWLVGGPEPRVRVIVLAVELDLPGREQCPQDCEIFPQVAQRLAVWYAVNALVARAARSQAKPQATGRDGV